MRSSRPKPLHRLCGRPMVLHVLDALAELEVDRVVVVVGHRAEWVTKTLVEHAPQGVEIEFVEQVEQHGTGDAMSVALTGLPDELDVDGDVVVLPGDTPLLRPATLAALVRHHRASDAAATLLTAVIEDPSGYGRVVRGRDEVVARVVEARRRRRGGAGGPRGQHLDLLLPAERAGSVAPAAQPGQRPGRVLPDRRGGRPLRGRAPGGLRGGGRHHGGGRGQRPGPTGRGRGRVARPDQRALDAAGRHHVGPRAHLHRLRCPAVARRRAVARGDPPGRVPGGRARRDRPQLPSGGHAGGRGCAHRPQRDPAGRDRR